MGWMDGCCVNRLYGRSIVGTLLPYLKKKLNTIKKKLFAKISPQNKRSKRKKIGPFSRSVCQNLTTTIKKKEFLTIINDSTVTNKQNQKNNNKK